jgi:hypothetical protein
MAVVRKRIRDAQPPHDREGDVIDNSRRADHASGVIRPCLLDFFRHRVQQIVEPLQLATEIIYRRPVGFASGGVPSFIEHERCRDQANAIFHQGLENRFGDDMPLVRDIPHRKESHGIQEYRPHG